MLLISGFIFEISLKTERSSGAANRIRQVPECVRERESAEWESESFAANL